jgi:hypothetical protein
LLLILRPFGISAGLFALLSPVGMLAALPLIAVGILGEYLLTLRTRILHRPVVVEERRINFLSSFQGYDGF